MQGIHSASASEKSLLTIPCPQQAWKAQAVELKWKQLIETFLLPLLKGEGGFDIAQYPLDDAINLFWLASALAWVCVLLEGGAMIVLPTACRP